MNNYIKKHPARSLVTLGIVFINMAVWSTGSVMGSLVMMGISTMIIGATLFGQLDTDIF